MRVFVAGIGPGLRGALGVRGEIGLGGGDKYHREWCEDRDSFQRPAVAAITAETHRLGAELCMRRGHVFPVSRLRVEIVSIDSNRHFIHGRTFVSDGAVIRIFASLLTSEDEIRSDWVMTHEMVHLAFPSVSSEHHWIEESIATYVEPIARVEAGNLDVRTVWHDMVEGLPNGLPRPGDEGLDHTHTWGRMYWGGALFCLLADLEIRERTGNRYGLQEALRGIIAAGGSMEVDWPLTRALEVGDAAVGVPVLTQLYERMKAKGVDPNLPAMWRRLGVEVDGSTVVFDDRASLAPVRRAIMQAPSSDHAPCVIGAKSLVF